MALARRDAAATPPVEPPRRLRPFLRMRRLSTSALDGVRRAVEEAPGLLSSMAEVAPSEEDLGGRASWLFVHRPDGWVEELAVLEAAAAASARSASSSEDAASERTARRRLKAVEAELAQVRAELEDVRGRGTAAAVTPTAAVDEERRAREAAEAVVAELTRRVEAIGKERDAAHRRASAADKALAEAVASATAAPLDGAGVDVDRARRDVASAIDAIGAAGRALDRAAGALAEPDPVAGSARRARSGREDRGPVRLPAPLPAGLFEDDPAAADHLVRLPSAVLLVDGYNLSLRRWSELPLPEQRTRLVDALNALAARVGVDVEVVFDGEEDAGRARQSSGGRRRAAAVTFSPSAVDADEVLLEAVDRLPISRAVVVATDDRRVQREAAARGANVIGSAQLFAVLGLSPGRSS